MKRVFMLSSQLLFSQGVEKLLQGVGSLEIVGRESDLTKALERIRELKPDVIVVDGQDRASAPAALIAEVLKEEPEAKVVALNLENEQVRVFRGEQHTAQTLDDLLELIDEDRFGRGPIADEEWKSLAAGRTEVYSLLAAVYSGPFDTALVENLRTNPLNLVSLGQGDDLTGDLQEGLRILSRFQEQAAARSAEQVRLELASEYESLMGQAGGGVSPGFACEATYTGGSISVSGGTCSVLSAAFAQAGLSLPPSARVRPDFVGCEIAFMQHLCSRELAAWEANDRGQACKYQVMEHSFLRDHLARWVPRFCDVLLARAQGDFYRSMAFLTRGFILNEAFRVSELIESSRPALGDWAAPGAGGMAEGGVHAR